ncbi:MAG: multinuclear nonheme iron-dependent oxidase, partial [Steroidobacteraceae bacterium]
GRALLIDSHDAPVADPVWQLYAHTLTRVGPMPTLIEWDSKLPPWSQLEDEAQRAAAMLRAAAARSTIVRAALP